MSFYQILKNTFKECFREPIFYILLVTSVFLIGLFPSLAVFAFNEQLKMVVDSAMAAILFFGLLVAVLSASNSVYRETQNGTLLLLLSKPVSRFTFIAAKICGVLLILTVFTVICCLATLVTVSMLKTQLYLDPKAFYLYYSCILLSALWGVIRNYFKRISFSASASYSLLFLFIALFVFNFLSSPRIGTDSVWVIQKHILPALILLMFAIWIIGTVTVVFSTRFNLLINLIFCLIIFILGLISDYLFGGGTSNILFKTLYGIIPNWQIFWLADAISNNKIIPLIYIFWSFLYTLLYIICCLIIANICFKNREVG